MSDFWVCDIHGENGEGNFRCYPCLFDFIEELYKKIDIDNQNADVIVGQYFVAFGREKAPSWQGKIIKYIGNGLYYVSWHKWTGGLHYTKIVDMKNMQQWRLMGTDKEEFELHKYKILEE